MEVVGLHPLEPDIFLLELFSDGNEIDWMSITQPIEGVPCESWQVAYDEQQLEQAGHWAFFFHYLDLDRPLRTPLGDIQLPRPTPAPEHLAHMKYEPPC